MAITSTAILKRQIALSEKFQKPEFRDRNYGTFQKLFENRDSVMPFLATPEGEASMDPQATNATAQVAAIKNSNDAVKTALESSHAGSVQTTATQSISWNTAAADFKISYKDASDNFFKKPELLDKALMSARQVCLVKAETDALAYLEAQRSQVSQLTGVVGATLPGVAFDAANDITTVAYAQKDLFYSLLSEIMEENNYRGELDFVHGGSLGVLAKDFIAQGTSNSVNKQYQISQMINFMRARIANGAGQYGLGYAFEAGTVGLATATPKLNREGLPSHANQIWDTFADPIYPGLNWGLHIIEGAEDGNKTQDATIEVELSLHYAFAKAYISTSGESVIHKVSLLDS